MRYDPLTNIEPEKIGTPGYVSAYKLDPNTGLPTPPSGFPFASPLYNNPNLPQTGIDPSTGMGYGQRYVNTPSPASNVSLPYETPQQSVADIYNE